MATKLGLTGQNMTQERQKNVQSQIEHLANHFYNRYRLRMLSEAPKNWKLLILEIIYVKALILFTNSERPIFANKYLVNDFQ